LKGCFRDKAGVLGNYFRLHEQEFKDQVHRIRTINSAGKSCLRSFQKDPFLPCSLGGLGVIKPKGFDHHTGKKAKLLAMHLIDRAIADNCELNSQLPLLGYEPEIFIEDMAVPWFCKEHEKIDSVIDVRKTIKMPSEWRNAIYALYKKTGITISVPNRAHCR
jgi:hypothetical protein